MTVEECAQILVNQMNGDMSDVPMDSPHFLMIMADRKSKRLKAIETLGKNCYLGELTLTLGLNDENNIFIKEMIKEQKNG